MKLFFKRIFFHICTFLFIATQSMVKLLRCVLSLLVSPVPCVLCGRQSFSVSLCPVCKQQLKEEASRAMADSRRCSCCGRPLLSEKDICTTCRKKPLFEILDGVFPVFTYVLSKKKLLYSWKITRQRNLSEVFAGYIADVIKSRYPEAVVVPVPPRPGKIHKNGWDQIEDIALYLEYVHHIRVERILKRTDAQQQKKLTKEERDEHSKHAYVIDARKMNHLDGIPPHVILLDDVITTGSTICACARLLKEVKGIQKVSATSLFIVPG